MIQALADEKGLHLVEMRKENDYYPRVVASPSDGKVGSPHSYSFKSTE